MDQTRYSSVRGNLELKVSDSSKKLYFSIQEEEELGFSQKSFSVENEIDLNNFRIISKT